jgi:hypothetical protein
MDSTSRPLPTPAELTDPVVLMLVDMAMALGVADDETQKTTTGYPDPMEALVSRYRPCGAGLEPQDAKICVGVACGGLSLAAA